MNVTNCQLRPFSKSLFKKHQAPPFNPIKAGGGVWRPPPYSFFALALICDTITVKFFDFL